MTSLDAQVRPHEAANNSWHAWSTKNGARDTYPPDMLLELHEAYSAGFLAGARYAVAASARMSNVFVELSDFLNWLKDQ